MPIVRWICLLSAGAMFSPSLVFSSAALSADLPVKPNHAIEEPRSSSRLCTDMDDKKFRWNWPNVPFASVCSDEEKDAKPPQPQPPK